MKVGRGGGAIIGTRFKTPCGLSAIITLATNEAKRLQNVAGNPKKSKSSC